MWSPLSPLPSVKIININVIINMAPWQQGKGNLSTRMVNFSVGAWKGWRLGRQMLILVFYQPFLEVKFLFCAINLSSLRCNAGHVPEAGFRRHAPRQQEGSWWYGWKAGLMCNAVSLMGIYISLSGRRSVSAITQPCCTAIASRATCEGMQPHIVSDPALDFSPPHRSCFWQFSLFFQIYSIYFFHFSTEAVTAVTCYSSDEETNRLFTSWGPKLH